MERLSSNNDKWGNAGKTFNPKESRLQTCAAIILHSWLSELIVRLLLAESITVTRVQRLERVVALETWTPGCPGDLNTWVSWWLECLVRLETSTSGQWLERAIVHVQVPARLSLHSERWKMNVKFTRYLCDTDTVSGSLHRLDPIWRRWGICETSGWTRFPRRLSSAPEGLWKR